jgi:hypothetical protein
MTNKAEQPQNPQPLAVQPIHCSKLTRLKQDWPPTALREAHMMLLPLAAALTASNSVTSAVTSIQVEPKTVTHII